MQAYGGLAAVQAGASGEPQLIRHTAADKITSLTAAQAITAALFARERGAGGQHLELSMLESVVNFVWADAAGNEVLLDSDGSQPSSFSRDQKLWPTKDGYVIAAPVSDGDVAAICRGVGVDGYDDPKVATIVARRQNLEAFQELLRRVYAAVSNMTTAEAIRGMEAERAPCGAVLGPAQLHLDPQVARARDARRLDPSRRGPRCASRARPRASPRRPRARARPRRRSASTPTRSSRSSGCASRSRRCARQEPSRRADPSLGRSQFRSLSPRSGTKRTGISCRRSTPRSVFV